MHADDAAPHLFWTLLLLYRVLWPALWPVLIAAAVIIADPPRRLVSRIQIV